jgi:AcrR family transcriptional regulator
MSADAPAPSRKDRAEALRHELVGAATALIAERGFEAMSVADVAEQAKVSKQVLLYHFKTKDALKDAVLDRLIEHANRSLIGLVGELATDETKRLEQLFASAQRFFDAEPHAAAVLLRFLLDRDEVAGRRIREGTQAWFALMSDELRRGQRAGRFRKDLDPEAAVVQVGMLVLTNFALLDQHGWTGRSRAEWRKRRLQELVRAMRSILYRDR